MSTPWATFDELRVLFVTLPVCRCDVNEGSQFGLRLAPGGKIEKQAGLGRQVGCKDLLECAGLEIGFYEEVDRIDQAQPEPGERDHAEMVVDNDATGCIERIFAPASQES